MDEDCSTTAAEYYYDEFKEASNITSFSSLYYDELITKLRLQSMEECGILRWQYHQQQQKLQEEQKEELQDQKRNKKIFLVDDEPDNCMVYQMVLEDAGYQCISYTDSVKALQEFKPYFYDLVILDIKMPQMDGFELYQEMKNQDIKNQSLLFNS